MTIMQFLTYHARKSRHSLVVKFVRGGARVVVPKYTEPDFLFRLR